MQARTHARTYACTSASVDEDRRRAVDPVESVSGFGGRAIRIANPDKYDKNNHQYGAVIDPEIRADNNR